MKKLFTFFILYLSFYSPLNALTSAERFEAIKAKYGDVGQFSPKTKTQHIYIESKNLKKKAKKISTFFQKHPNKILIIDFKMGDGFVSDQGQCTFKRDSLPQHVRNCIVKNIAQDITKIRWSFLKGRTQLSDLTLDLPQLKTIESGFLEDCIHLESLALNLPELETIWSSFLKGCKQLKHLTFHFPKLKEIGDDFLRDCKSLENLPLDFPQLKIIHGSILYACEKITTLTLNFPALEKTGSYFLSSCIKLKSLTLTAPKLIEIKDYFLSNCLCLKQLTLNCPHVTQVGDYFLMRCENLTEIHGIDHVQLVVQRAIVAMLRESNNPLQQQLGANFYMRYIYVPDPKVKAALAPWDLEELKAITPKPLDDIPDMTKENVFDIFNRVMIAINTTYAEKLAQHEENPQKYDKPQKLPNTYESHLIPILRFLFGEDVTITWKMYNDNKAEMAITMKHMAKHLEILIQNPRGLEEATSYMSYLLDGFVHCQTRQASVLNHIGILMGIMPMTNETGHMKPIYEMVNAYKLQQFEEYAGEDKDVKDGAVHAYARYFTVINSRVGLPVAMQSFKERMSKITDGEADNMLAVFFTAFFTPDFLANYVLQEIQKIDGKSINQKGNTLSGMIHNFMAKKNDTYWLEQLDEGFDDDDDGVARFNIPVTQDEIKTLLGYMDILKTNAVLMENENKS